MMGLITARTESSLSFFAGGGVTGGCSEGPSVAKNNKLRKKKVIKSGRNGREGDLSLFGLSLTIHCRDRC